MKSNNTTQPAHCSTNQPPSHEQIKKAMTCRKNQKQFLLKYMQERREGISTLEARQKGIMSPAPRMMELKEQGYNILSTKDWNNNGMVTYTLISSKGAIK